MVGLTFAALRASVLQIETRYYPSNARIKIPILLGKYQIKKKGLVDAGVKSQ